MNYQVIARRYRPRRFEEVVGQESVGTTLRHAILQNRLAHAYLFTGPRGVGKTSMARIFAKALNCPRASDRSRPPEDWAVPCNECDLCRAIHSGEDIDVLEVDGASYRGIDDVRDIVENVKFTPSRSPYKIFIIDEVHMLTREAFNALLKTLEEPPSHVKFVFATTEAHKIPETVLSRLQRFDFRPITEADIVQRLRQICDGEKVVAEAGLLEKIARYGKGGLRDAQTLLDQAITFAEGSLRSEDLERITGRLPDDRIDSLVAAIEARDPGATFRALGLCFEAGGDPATILEQVTERLHAGLEALLAASVAEKSPSEKSAAGIDGLDLHLGRLQVLGEAALKLRASPQPRLQVELALVKLSRLEDPRALDRALAYLKDLEEKGAYPPAASHSREMASSRETASSREMASSRETTLGRPRFSGPAPSPAPPEAPVPAAPIPAPPRAPAATAAIPAADSAAAPAAAPAPTAAEPPPDFARLQSLWSQIIIEGKERFPQISAFLSRSRLAPPREPGKFTLQVPTEFALKQLKDPRRREAFETLVQEVTRSPWRMSLELSAALAEEQAAGGGSSGGGAGGAPGSSGPAGGGTAGGGRNGGGANGTPAAPARGSKALPPDEPLVKKSVDLFKGKIL